MKSMLVGKTFLFTLLLLVLSTPLHAKLSVFDSPHNLSIYGGRGRASGQPGVTVAGEQRVCVFCHVPHNATAGTPLWSRSLSPEGTEYIPYRSSTLAAEPKPDRPTGASKLCLSCHDGTIALNRYAGSKNIGSAPIPTEQGFNNPNLSTDLSDDHPISFGYTQALGVKSHLVSPQALPAEMRLEGGVNVECTTCHDPHDNQYGNFLVMNNGDPNRPNFVAGSPLCTACHQPVNWDSSSHNSTLVESLAAGCLSCHAAHNAPWAVRLLRGTKQSDTCLGSCHNGNDTSSQNMKALVTASPYRHPVDDLVSDPVHDENEVLPAETYHVQCVDCHNPHQANSANAPLASPPQIDGRLRGVRIDTVGNVATAEYQVCFRCHAGDKASRFAGITQTMPNRVIAEPNQENRFDLQNPSFHPVTADRRSNGASLLATYQPTMTRIYCSDCHGSSQSRKAGGAGPDGPHGSQYEHILLAQYYMPRVTDPRIAYNASQYSLCFRCHYEPFVMDSGSAFSNGGVNEHSRHVRDRQIPCFACHDPHGVSWKMLATPTNNAHLINFDRNYAAGGVVSTPVYVSAGVGQGNCTVNCHTVAGNLHNYSPSGSVTPKLLRPKLLSR
ncbi:cytochrome C [Geomonas paludis]|uniref:Cytochrome C n=1 Tax=Geomonas paludis TaxID=2740185 RepID=A0A6V8MXM2_9BACT|nr:cytochrome c3 family protein [Geomonas paludis]UPU37073.1 cytochrome C [Geomonas paludis]GFO64830.1 cytochrome c [Geomonas paludis]